MSLMDCFWEGEKKKDGRYISFKHLNYLFKVAPSLNALCDLLELLEKFMQMRRRSETHKYTIPVTVRMSRQKYTNIQ